MNPVFEKFMQSMPLPGPLQNVANVINQFNQFRNGFSGDPRAQVQQMLQNGQMTQEQFSQLENLANQIYPMVKNGRS